MKLDEQIKAILGEENLAEGTAEKLAELVESAITAKLDEATATHTAAVAALTEAHVEEVSGLRTELTEGAAKYAEYVTDEVTAKIDSLVEAAVTTYQTENADKFAKLELFERMEKSFGLIQEAFEQNGFAVKEDAVSTKLQEDVDSATAAYNHLFEQVKELKGELNEAQMVNAFNAATASLSDTQKEKVQALAESIQFEGVEQFGKALELIVSQTITKSADSTVVSLTENQETILPAKVVSDKMKQYVDRL
jgi:hypothetical protein